MSSGGAPVARDTTPHELQPCGTPAAYRRGCRCPECRAANAERNRAGGFEMSRRARLHAARVERGGRLVSVDPGARHGEADTYNRFGCRCAECTSAWAAYSALRRGGAA